MTELLSLEAITQVGFPVFVAAWFMYRDQRTVAVIESNTKAMQAISDRVARCPYKEEKNGN